MEINDEGFLTNVATPDPVITETHSFVEPKPAVGKEVPKQKPAKNTSSFSQQVDFNKNPVGSEKPTFIDYQQEPGNSANLNKRGVNKALVVIVISVILGAILAAIVAKFAPKIAETAAFKAFCRKIRGINGPFSYARKGTTIVEVVKTNGEHTAVPGEDLWKLIKSIDCSFYDVKEGPEQKFKLRRLRCRNSVSFKDLDGVIQYITRVDLRGVGFSLITRSVEGSATFNSLTATEVTLV